MTDRGQHTVTTGARPEHKVDTTRARSALLLFGALLLGLVLSLTAFVGVTAQRSSSAVIDELWADSADQLAGRVTLHVQSIFQPAERFGRYSRRMVEEGRLEPADTPVLFDHLESTIDAFPTVVWASYATVDGQYISVYRWPNKDRWEVRRTHRVIDPDGKSTWFREDVRGAAGVWTSSRDDHDGLYDPREKAWYRAAAQGGPTDEHWAGPLLFFSRKQVGVIYSTPDYDTATGEMRGVWAAEFEAQPVVDYLARLDTTAGTRVYVVGEEGTIIARPDGPLVNEDGLIHATNADDALLGAAWERVEQGGASAGEPFVIGEHVAMFREMPAASGLPWKLIVTVPTAELFAETREQSRLAIIIGIVGVLLSLLLTVAAAFTLNRLIRRQVATAIAETKVGQYTLEAKLGEGGMGEVYRAQHSMIRRPTAVKVLQAKLNSPVDMQRFEREVQMTCRLSHPNTITIFDYGRTPDGRFYYAMELIDGATLLDLVEYAGPLPAGRVIYIAKQICAALAEAHAAGLVHRDIKPANVLIAELGGLGDFVKVVDFGLVKDTAAEEGITQDNSFAGTPGFLAPEVPMSPHMVGPVTDLYSVGSVLYVLLTGELPYAGDSGMEIFMKQQTEPPRPLSERIDLGIPADLEEVVLRCMARQPVRRPQSASELIESLRACAASDDWGEEEAASWWAEHGERLRAVAARDDREVDSSTTIVAATRPTE